EDGPAVAAHRAEVGRQAEVLVGRGREADPTFHAGGGDRRGGQHLLAGDGDDAAGNGDRRGRVAPGVDGPDRAEGRAVEVVEHVGHELQFTARGVRHGDTVHGAGVEI